MPDDVSEVEALFDLLEAGISGPMMPWPKRVEMLDAVRAIRSAYDSMQEAYEQAVARTEAANDDLDSMREERDAALKLLQTETDWTANAANDLTRARELKDQLAAAASRKHGRDCPCTPCQAEDWDAVERGIADDVSEVEALEDHMKRLKDAAAIQGIGGTNVTVPVVEVEGALAALRSKLAGEGE